MKTTTLTFLCLTALATQTQASTPEAWAAFDKAMLASCIKASGLQDASPSAKPHSSTTGSTTPPCSCKAATRKNT